MMKRFLMLPALGLVLLSCAPAVTTNLDNTVATRPATNAPSFTDFSGGWTITLTTRGQEIQGRALLFEADEKQPGGFTAGDFFGRLILMLPIVTEDGVNVEIEGNRNAGTLREVQSTSNPSGSPLICQGAFTGLTYKGNCNIKSNGGSDRELTLEMVKVKP